MPIIVCQDAASAVVDVAEGGEPLRHNDRHAELVRDIVADAGQGVLLNPSE